MVVTDRGMALEGRVEKGEREYSGAREDRSGRRDRLFLCN